MNIDIEDFNIEDPDQGYYVAAINEETSNQNYWDELYPEITAWLVETFGDEDFWGSEPVNGWKRMANKYYFTTEDKRNLFLLRWA